MDLSGEWDQMWMAVVLNQTKKGLPLLPFRSRYLSVWSRTSPSKVSMRLRVSGPVFSIFCLPTRPNLVDRRIVHVVAQRVRTPRGPYFSL